MPGLKRPGLRTVIDTPAPVNLRQQIFRGGLFLAGRHVLGIIVSAAGVLLLTRQIGPGNYGLFVAALGVFTYASFIAQFGLDVYLIRREGEPDEDDWHLGFTLLLASGLLVALLGAGAVLLFQGDAPGPSFLPLAWALLAGLPVTMLVMVPAARLERRLDYRRLAIVEVSALVVLHTVSLSAAFAGLEQWSPILGWWVQQIFTVAVLYIVSGYRPRLCWDRGRASAMLRYGAGYAFSMSIWQLRSLVNPLIVLPWAGPAAVGYIGLATRFVELLSLIRTTAWRLAIAAFGRFISDRQRSLSALTEGMRLQVLGVGAPLAAFAIAGPFVMPLLFGTRWSEWAPAMEVYPYLAIGALCNALFSLHSSVLYVMHRNAHVALFHAAHVALLGAAAAYLVPRYGIVGLGLAEIAAVPAYFVIHVSLARVLGSPGYGVAAVWAVAASMLLFAPRIGWVAAGGLVAAALWPATWRVFQEYVRMLRPQREEIASHA
jgi:O-antigen/teichoic acid export membrane protein